MTKLKFGIDPQKLIYTNSGRTTSTEAEASVTYDDWAEQFTVYKQAQKEKKEPQTTKANMGLSFICMRCDSTYPFNKKAQTIGGPICIDCAKSKYKLCPKCNYYHSNECALQITGTSTVGEWNHSEQPIFHKGKESSGIFLGLEHEVYLNNRASYDDIMRITQPRHFLYAIFDGSIKDRNGLEVNTHPLETTWINENWDKIEEYLEMLRSLNIKATTERTCALHIHLNIDAFDDNDHVLRLLNLCYDNKQMLYAISQRQNPAWMQQYASTSLRLGDRRVIAKYLYSGAKKFAVIPRNGCTVEYRLFRGSLYPTVIKKNMQFVLSTLEYTRNAENLTKDAYLEYVMAHEDKYPELRKFVRAVFCV